MHSKRRFSRRSFIKLTGAGLALGAGLVYGRHSLASLLNGDPGTIDRAIRDHKLGQLSDTETQAYVALYMTGGGGKAKVVHGRNANATNWDGSGWYGDAVNQTAVNTMVQQGLQELTSKSSWGDIWNELFSRVQPSGYQPGQKIAVKVNLNNSSGCGDRDNTIDAIPHPVKALIAGLKQAGVQEQDIWIHDATIGGRYIPDRFRNPIVASYPSVAFYGKGSCTGVNAATFNHVHASLEIQFSDPDSNLSNRWLPDLLYQATYVINMPILKKHGIHPVTLGFKNHFGNLNNIIRGGNDNLHYYIRPTHSLYESTYSPLLDICRNPNIKDKTVLVIGDGLFGAPGATQAPSRWSTFDNDYPQSFFFATDTVAIDCVMTDFVRREWTWGMEGAHDYLFCAQEAGLGVCEGTRSNPGGDPWQLPYGSGYNDIQYIRIGL